MFAAGGYEATSLRQIAGAADVDLATLKYHFGSKSALFAELYKEGHDAILAVLSPFLSQTATMTTKADVEAAVDQLASGAAEFLFEYDWFCRLFLYRILEDSSEISGLEEQLEGIAFGMIEVAVQRLVDRGMLRPIDVRAMISLLVSGIAMWSVAAAGKPGWLGTPKPDDPEWRPRVTAFVRDVLRRLLLG
jgi:AcrR family transcriptional regulator